MRMKKSVAEKIRNPHFDGAGNAKQRFIGKPTAL
jgi:hypothetical protein